MSEPDSLREGKTLIQRMVISALLLFLVAAGQGVTSGSDCNEAIVIDSVEYTVSDYWCGKKLDSSQIAELEMLSQLPPELTFEDYRIFVLTEARDAFVAMAEAAHIDSIKLTVDSGFRSLDFQRRIIKRRLAAGDDFETVLNSVAPPGYSEHHTGRAFDLCPSEARFAFSETYTWLQKHAARFGFYETLPEDPAAPLTWESWHWTYTGPPSPDALKTAP